MRKLIVKDLSSPMEFMDKILKDEFKRRDDYRDIEIDNKEDIKLISIHDDKLYISKPNQNNLLYEFLVIDKEIFRISSFLSEMDSSLMSFSEGEELPDNNVTIIMDMEYFENTDKAKEYILQYLYDNISNLITTDELYNELNSYLFRGSRRNLLKNETLFVESLSSEVFLPFKLSNMDPNIPIYTISSELLTVLGAEVVLMGQKIDKYVDYAYIFEI